MSSGTPVVRRASAAGYLVAFLGTEVVVQLVGLLKDPASEEDLPAQFVIYLFGVAVGIVLWWRYRPDRRASGAFALVIALMGLMWIVETARELHSGTPLNPLYLTVPILLLMLWLKPPDARGARRTIDLMALLLVGVVVAAVALEAAGMAGSWYGRDESFAGLVAFDRANYWLPFADVLGLDGRWAGPFPHPNHAGPVGGFLLVVGLCRQGWLRALLLVTGASVLLLTASRTSILATAAGVAAVGVAWWLTRPSSWPRSLRVALATAPAVLLAAAMITVNAGISGRNEIWPVYWDIWLESPLLGVPDSRIEEAVAVGDLPNWAASAHNLVLDSLVRYGIAGTGVALAVLVVSSTLAWRTAMRRSYVSLGVMAMILACGLTEALIFWGIFATSTILLVLAIVASLEASEDPPKDGEPSDLDAGTTAVGHEGLSGG